MTNAAFVPAAGRRGLTALYDPVIALTMREQTFRSRLVAQVAAGDPAIVLEIGCGTGSLSVRLAGALPTARVVAIDPDTDALARARAKDRGGRIEFSEVSRVSWPWPTNPATASSPRCCFTISPPPRS